MWLISGTIPMPDFPLSIGAVWKPSKVEGNKLVLPDNQRLPITRGTSALAATAIEVCKILGSPQPHLLLTGDCGDGAGSFLAYDWLAEHLPDLVSDSALAGLTLHYFYPDLDHHNKFFMKLEQLPQKPLLVADAGFMYVAKMSGYAAEYDLFTPDMGELAFLADENAPHPFYTRGFLLAEEENAAPLIKRALSHGNCPANMIVKGKTDYIVCGGEIEGKISEPSVPAMECIGGTGDIVTGFVTAFLAAGFPIRASAICAARATRYLARFCQPNPATQVATLIANISPMFEEYAKEIMYETMF